MSQAIPTQHPAVVLRSHFQLVRALLIASLVAVIGLTTALVVVANDDNDAAVQQSAESLGALRYGDFNPATGRPNAAPMPDATPLPARKLDGTADGIRYDGGPEEGTAAIESQVHSHPLQSRYDGGPEEGGASSAMSSQAPSTRYDGGPEEGSRGPGFSTD